MESYARTSFLGEPLIDIKVRFTPKGLLRYEYSVIHRPVRAKVEIDAKINDSIVLKNRRYIFSSVLQMLWKFWNLYR